MIRVPRITVRKRNMLIKAFVLDLNATQAAKMAKVSRMCANRHYRHLRELIYIQSRKAPRFHGEIEMDQTFFGGRGKKKEYALVRRLAGLTTREIKHWTKDKKRKPDKKIQVFGILNRSGAVYAQIIPRADRNTILPIIYMVVEPGATVYTDEWAAFNKLTHDRYNHKPINHSVEYSNRKGVHINGIEAFWSFCKHRLGRFHGIARSTFALHIKECEFRYNNEDVDAAVHHLLNPLKRSRKKSAKKRPH